MRVCDHPAMDAVSSINERLRVLVSTDEDIERVDALTRTYWFGDSPPPEVEMPSQFTGRYFETFRDLDEPNRITEKDLVASRC